MQTTLRLDDELYRTAKSEAAREGISMTKFLEESIKQRLRSRNTMKRRQIELPVCHSKIPDSMDLSPAGIKKMLAEMDYERDVKNLNGGSK